MERKLAALLLLFALATRCAYADDSGPGGDIRELRFVAPRLLVHRVRQLGTDPKNITISDVVAVQNAAILSWDAGKHHGFMGLMRLGSRWWEALDWENCEGWTAYPLVSYFLFGVPPPPQALRELGFPTPLVNSSSHNRDTQKLNTQCRANRVIEKGPEPIPIYHYGGLLSTAPLDTSGYALTIRYRTKASRSAGLNVYARAPTDAEFMPYPTTPNFVSTSVAYFDITINGSAPVTFVPGTTIDVWFPFVLDDSLQYDLTIGYADKPIGPIYAKPFDNVLHYVLPGFTTTPGRTLMAEIDGDWP